MDGKTERPLTEKSSIDLNDVLSVQQSRHIIAYPEPIQKYVAE